VLLGSSGLGIGLGLEIGLGVGLGLGFRIGFGEFWSMWSVIGVGVGVREGCVFKMLLEDQRWSVL